MDIYSDSLPPLKDQEIPLDDPDSCNMFQAGVEKPFVATPDAMEMYTRETIFRCLAVLQQKAKEHNGLDYLRVFDGESIGKNENLWFIEDAAVTALLPSNY